jgi:hypothetical protein
MQLCEQTGYKHGRKIPVQLSAIVGTVVVQIQKTSRTAVIFINKTASRVVALGAEPMVASGFGIAAHLPYLKRLIHGYNARKLRARRIHLVWQVRDIGKSLKRIIFSKTKI